MKIQWRFAAVVCVAMSLWIGQPAVMAKEVAASPRPLSLFNNLSVPPARWAYEAESAYVMGLPSWTETADLTLKLYATPDGKHYYFGVVSLPDRHTLFVANRKLFHSLAQWKSYIRDQSDFELIGASLGVYNGPITVTVQQGHSVH